MTVLGLLCWVVYILIVTLIVSFIYKSNSTLPSFVSAVVGSFIGGFFNWVLGYGDRVIEPSGIVMGILGTIVFLFLWDKYLKDVFDDWTK